jgi:hypothetical protein
MTKEDEKDFFHLISGIHAFYRQDFSEMLGELWLLLLRPFDLGAISSAFMVHCRNPDNQYPPKPGDIVRLLQGTTQDVALLAWTAFERAVRCAGIYRDVVFDDKIIHRTVQDMGGWTKLCEKDEKEWPFIRNEFVTRYRSYALRTDKYDYPLILHGLAGWQNRLKGYPSDPPILIGDPVRARQVMDGGSDRPLISYQIAEDEKCDSKLLTHNL